MALLGDGISDLDAVLAAAGVRRRFALVTPHFAAAQAAVAATDCITTVSARFAAHFADSMGLLLKPPPFADSAIDITAVWSDLRSGDPLQAWFRMLLAEEAAVLTARQGQLITK